MTERDDVLARFGENGIGHATLPVGDAYDVILAGRGGHILGPFDRNTGESVFWISPAFGSRDEFARLLAEGGWNVGGMRLWIAPEIRFGVRDRARYWETLTVQDDMEPAAAAIEMGSEGELLCGYALRLSYYNPESGAKRLVVERRVRPVPDPLAAVPDANGLNLRYCGFAHDCRLMQEERDGRPVEIWNLVQVRGGGRALVPTLGRFEYEDYYEPLGPSHLKVGKRHASLELDGRKRFKIGVRSHCHFGRIGHVRRVGDEDELIVCSYYNDPGAWYAEQPADAPACRGLSMHFYNDGGMFGGFGELEGNGRTLGVNGYPDSIEDSFSVWCYRGTPRAVARAGEFLLGIKDMA